MAVYKQQKQIYLWYLQNVQKKITNSSFN